MYLDKPSPSLSAMNPIDIKASCGREEGRKERKEDNEKGEKKNEKRKDKIRQKYIKKSEREIDMKNKRK